MSTPGVPGPDRTWGWPLPGGRWVRACGLCGGPAPVKHDHNWQRLAEAAEADARRARS